jgi:ABC-2 type transport system ATP-binding protein
MPDNQIIVQNLTKDYPKVKAVDNISFTVAAGEIFGLLGPNGAGKTTTIRLLMTLIKPTQGKINILGFDAKKHSEKIRQLSGYVPQDVSIDSDLTGYENILMYSKLYNIPSRGRKEAINEILDYLDMKERAKDMSGTYSGGMMRRLEIAQALVNRPQLLFLDEPSIGLDPGAKRVIWDLIQKLREQFGTIVFINTHDMNEADILCDRIGIMEKGKLAVIGSPSELKNSLGGDVLTVTSKKSGLSAGVKKLGYTTITESANGQIDLLVNNGEKLIPSLVESLQAQGIEVDSVSLKKPTLDDVFLKYTGARIDTEDTSFKQARQTRRTFRRMNK